MEVISVRIIEKKYKTRYGTITYTRYPGKREQFSMGIKREARSISTESKNLGGRRLFGEVMGGFAGAGREFRSESMFGFNPSRRNIPTRRHHKKRRQNEYRGSRGERVIILRQ